MDIVIDIQGFRDVEENFIPKEVAVLAINAAITGHWIMTSPCPFEDLPVRAKRENNWLTRNYHGIEWFDGDVNSTNFTIHLRDITRHARYIYTRGQEKTRYLSNLLSRNVYNLEGISPAFKNLPDFEDRGQRCTHHGFRASAESHCALRNAYKLKRWLTVRRSNNSSYDNLSSGNWSESVVESEETDSENSSSIQFKNQKHDIARNIEATKKTNHSADKQVTDEEKKDLSKFDSLTDRDKANTNVSQASSILGSSTLHTPAKEVHFEFTQTFPLSRSPMTRNEFAGSFKRITSSPCTTCRGLSCRSTAEGVDEVDRHCR